ncbi:hypothetical protein O1L55_23730 [Streptomyces albulus]|nr:hypothetical protein [Streptomyces noursei]
MPDTGQPRRLAVLGEPASGAPPSPSWSHTAHQSASRGTISWQASEATWSASSCPESRSDASARRTARRCRRRRGPVRGGPRAGGAARHRGEEFEARNSRRKRWSSKVS